MAPALKRGGFGWKLIGRHLIDDSELADEAVEWLEKESVANVVLIALDECPVYLYCMEDVQWAEKEGNPQGAAIIRARIGKGDIKVSGGISHKSARLGLNLEDVLDLYTAVFDELNARYPGKMRYLAGSCAFGGENFTPEQIWRITEGGRLLSGRESVHHEKVLAMLKKVGSSTVNWRAKLSSAVETYFDEETLQRCREIARERGGSEAILFCDEVGESRHDAVATRMESGCSASVRTSC